MSGGLAIWTASVMLAVDVGWQPYPDGGLEYIIQIEPHMLESLRTGEDIQSAIPPNLGRVRAFRITVGSAFVPREALPVEATSEAAASSPPASEPNLSLPSLPFRDNDSNPTESNASEAPQLPPLNLPPPPGSDGQLERPFGPFGALNSATENSLSSRPRSFSDPLTTRASDIGRAETEPPSLTFSSEGPSGGRATTEPPQRLPNHSQQAVYIEEEGPSANTMLKPELTGEVELEADKPWLPFTLSLAGLFGSLGGMLYFGWVAWDYRVVLPNALRTADTDWTGLRVGGFESRLHERSCDGDEI